MVFGKSPSKGLSRIDVFRGVYKHERIVKNTIPREKLKKCEAFRRIDNEKPKRLSTGIISPWELYEGTAKITPEVVGYEHRPKQASRRISRSVPDLRSSDVASEAPVLPSNESNDTKSERYTPTSLEFVDVIDESDYSIPSFRYRERHARLYLETEAVSRTPIIDEKDVEKKRLKPTLNHHPSFRLDRGQAREREYKESGLHRVSMDGRIEVSDQDERIDVVPDGKIDSYLGFNREINVRRNTKAEQIRRATYDERTQVSDQGARDERLKHTLRRHASFLDRGETSRREMKDDALRRVTIDDTIDVSDGEDDERMQQRSLTRHPSYLKFNRETKNVRRNTKAEQIRRVSSDNRTRVAIPSASLSALSPHSPSGKMFSSRTSNSRTSSRARKLSTIQEEDTTPYEFPDRWPSEMLLSPDLDVSPDAHETRELRFEETMPRKFFRRRFSRRISYDEDIDQPEVLLRRKVGKLLIPDIFKGNSTDEDQSSQSSKDLGEWDIPDWYVNTH